MASPFTSRRGRCAGAALYAAVGLFAGCDGAPIGLEVPLAGVTTPPGGGTPPGGTTPPSGSSGVGTLVRTFTYKFVFEDYTAPPVLGATGVYRFRSPSFKADPTATLLLFPLFGATVPAKLAGCGENILRPLPNGGGEFYQATPVNGPPGTPARDSVFELRFRILPFKGADTTYRYTLTHGDSSRSVTVATRHDTAKIGKEIFDATRYRFTATTLNSAAAPRITDIYWASWIGELRRNVHSRPVCNKYVDSSGQH